MNRVIDAPVAPREEDGVFIVPVVEEVPVVERRLMLKEEVRISRRRTESRQLRKVALRAEEVKIERIPASESRKVRNLRRHGRPA